MAYRPTTERMKCEIAKRALLPYAVRHYLKNNRLYRFMSLYEDEERYPVTEVIELQREHIAELTKQSEEWTTNESLKTALFIAKTALTDLTARMKKGFYEQTQ